MAGAVRHPGVFELDEGSRVHDAVTAAGGCLESAAPQGLNLARTLADGEQLVVPTQDEWAKAVEAGSLPGAVAAGELGGGAGASAGSSAGSGLVDLNAADAATLETLPGIGPATAAKIVEEREANGPFATVDDLARVSGIGPKKIDAIRELVAQ